MRPSLAMDTSGDARPAVVVVGNDRLLLQLVGELDALGESSVFVIPPDEGGLVREATELGAAVINPIAR